MLGEVGVYVVKRIFVSMSEIEGSDKAFSTAQNAYNLLLRIYEETSMSVKVVNVLSHFTAEQTKKLALAGFRSGLDGEEGCIDHFDLSLDWEIPNYYFDRYGDSEDAGEEAYREWWGDQDKIVAHYLNLGARLRSALTE